MTVEERTRFGALLRSYRAAAGLSQEALAERAGLSRRGIADLERGARSFPHGDTAQRLAAALELAPDERAGLLAAAVPVRRRASVQPTTTDNEARHNLPPELTSFVGRQHDIATVTDLLARTRLLTLTGTGGVGKSRLALQVATGQLDRFPDGVWLVELAPLADSALVPDTVLAAMAIPQQSGRPALHSVLGALRTRQLLLVLDNCEHLPDACALLTEAVLRNCAHVRILATSREPLRVVSETRWRVPSLSLPPVDEFASQQPVAACEAVQLFLERARTVQPSFSLTSANVPVVARICTQLDGIPLALELAAARLSALGIADLAAHLDQRFRLLTGGGRSTLPRHRTLEATVTWSYDLLTPEEQSLFARLSVFAGGWTLEAAEAAAAGESVAREDVLDLLSHLVDKSLVVAELLDDGRTWYRLLETMRQYGWQRLSACGERAAVQRRHALFYLALSEIAGQGLHRRDARHWFDRLDREHDNLRAVLTWGLDQGGQGDAQDEMPAIEIGLRIAGNLIFFWIFRDHYRERLAWLDQALPRAGATPLNVRARALLTATYLAGFMNALTRSQALAADTVALCREVGERGPLSMAVGVLGWALWRSGQEQQAKTAQEESLALARLAGEPWVIAFALMGELIWVTSTAARERAEERTRALTAGTESLRLFRTLGDEMYSAIVEEHLGQIAMFEGDYQRARTAFTGCLPTFDALGWRSEVAATVVRLADTAHAMGDDEEATNRYEQALGLYRQLGDEWLPAVALVHSHLATIALEREAWDVADRHVSECLSITHDTGLEIALPFGEAPLPDALEARAALAAEQEPLKALRLGGAAAALRAHLHQPLTATAEVMLEQRLAPARLALTADEQAQAWAEGQRMTSDEAIAVALEVSG
jgi:predicted ATPase/transcriptional regulator with XRE-family HTH domain